MRLTRRGRVVVGIVVLAVLLGTLYGPRALDAVVVPGAVALVAAVVQIHRAHRPTIERHLPERGMRDETVAVRLDVETDDPITGRLTDEVDDGIAATGNDRLVTLKTGPIEYEITLTERGPQRVGPLSIEITDVLGLVTSTYRYEGRDEILVRPRIHPVSVRVRDIYGEQGDLGPDRGDFDYLREYEPGDPFHDIHWKSSAKATDSDLLVMEFAAGDEGTEAITIAVDAIAGTADETADAAASLVDFLLESGFEVGLRTLAESHEPRMGLDQRKRLLDALARLEDGTVPKQFRSEAEFIVRGTERGVVLEAGDRSVRLDDLLESPATEASEGVSSAAI